MRRPAGVFAITHCTLKLRSYRHFGMTPRDITTWGRDSLLTNLSLEVPLYISHCKLMKDFVWPKHPDYPHYIPMKSLYHHSMIRPSSLCFMYFSWLTNDFRQTKKNVPPFWPRTTVDLEALKGLTSAPLAGEHRHQTICPYILRLKEVHPKTCETGRVTGGICSYDFVCSVFWIIWPKVDGTAKHANENRQLLQIHICLYPIPLHLLDLVGR